MENILTSGAPAHKFTKEDAVKGGLARTVRKKVAARFRGLRLTTRPLQSFEVLATNPQASVQQLYQAFEDIWKGDLSATQRLKAMEILVRVHEAAHGKKIISANLDLNRMKEQMQSWYSDDVKGSTSNAAEATDILTGKDETTLKSDEDEPENKLMRC